MKTVLITGASGFLGKVCKEKFDKAGYSVVTTDKIPGSDIIGDLSNKSFVEALPEVDIVVNCAAVQYVTKNLPFLNRSKFFRDNNVCTAENLVDRYRSTNCHFIHIGTSMMYEQNGEVLSENSSSMHGVGIYSESKQLAQNYINKLKDSATIVPCIIGGKGREGLFRGFVNTAKRFGIIFYPGKGKHLVHMVHVEDVADLIVLVANKKGSGLYNAAAPDPLCIDDWARIVGRTVGVTNLRVIRFPISLIDFASKLLGYRILAREQLLMLKIQHTLSVERSYSLGWIPKHNNKKIIVDITKYVLEN